MERPRFQYGYSKKFSAYMYDEASRRDKALRTVALVKDFLTCDVGECSCLEMGSAAGIMCYYLADYFKSVVGIDIDTEALAYAKKHYQKSNITYHEMDAHITIFPDKSFDVIVCHHTYEHVYDSQLLVHEIKRLLKDDGVCYFGAPNRLMLIESHYNIPFLSWLPRSVAHILVRVFSRDQYYYEHMYSYWGLKKLLKDFIIHDYTRAVFKDSDTYHTRDIAARYRIMLWVPEWILKALTPFYPDYIFMLTKKHS